MQINIEKLKLNAIIGCYPEERIKSQVIILSAQMILYTENYQYDQLNQSIDYDHLISTIKDFIANTKFLYLEKLIFSLIDHLFQTYDVIKQIKIDLSKELINQIHQAQINISHQELRKHMVALALGSNTEFSPIQQLITASQILTKYLNDIKLSPIYQSSAYGYKPQADFYNLVLTAYTTFSPEILLAKIKSIEKLMAKMEQFQNGPRIIDIDIIFYQQLVYDKNYLTIPHNDMQNRDFVLQPLSDIAPDWTHPLLQQNVIQLLNQIQTSTIIKKISKYK